MRLRVVSGRKAAAPYLATATMPDAAENAAGGDSDRDESKEESFFEARPWLDSDSDDDFYSVRGDFTPSRGSTPDHYRLTPFSGRIPVDNRSKPCLVQKKQRLIELLQEKQHYDDEDDSATDISSDVGDSTVHAEEHLKKPTRKVRKVKKSSKSGCFPSLIWKHSFKICRNVKTEDKLK